MDSDDWISSNTFQECIDYLTDCELVRFSAAMVLDPECRKIKIISINEINDIKEYFEEVFSRRTLMTVWGGFYKREIVKKYNLSFDVNIRNGEDWLFLMQYSLNVTKIRIINTPLYYYNMCNVSSCIHTMTIDKLFESVISFNRMSEEIRKKEDYQDLLINGKIAILGFLSRGFIWQNLGKKELLNSKKRAQSIISPFPRLKEIWSSKQPLFDRIIVSSLLNNTVFVVVFQL